MNEISSAIIKSINTILNERLKNLKYDKTFKATVRGRNEDETYQILYLGQPYNVYNALGTKLTAGQSVWIKIPGGIFRNMHICGVNYKTRNRQMLKESEESPCGSRNSEERLLDS